jgi:hypothetical protein
LERKLLGARLQDDAQNTAVTYIVHASKGDAVAVTVRLRVTAAIAKARSLSDDGWSVVIIGPDEVRYAPSEFHNLPACPES